MTVTIIYEYSAADGYTTESNATWATVRDSSTGSFTVNSTSTARSVAGRLSGSVYYISQSYFAFDVSSITGTTTSAVINTNFNFVTATDTYGFSMRVHDWGTTLEAADHSSRSELQAMTEVATIAFPSGTGRADWTSTSDMATTIDNTSSVLRLVAAPVRQISDVIPTANYFANISSYESYGLDSYLTVTWTPQAGTTTSTIYQDSAADGRTSVYGNSSWATTRDTDSAVSVTTTGTDTIVGTAFYNNQYEIYQSFFSFDVSSISGVVYSSSLNTNVTTISSADTYGFSARQFDWGTTLDASDHCSRTELNALTELAILNYPASTGWKQWSTTAELNSAVDSASVLRMVLAPERQIRDATPNGSYTVYFSTYESVNDPYLTVVWETPAVTGTAAVALGGLSATLNGTRTVLGSTARDATLGVTGLGVRQTFGQSTDALGSLSAILNGTRTTFGTVSATNAITALLTGTRVVSGTMTFGSVESITSSGVVERLGIAGVPLGMEVTAEGSILFTGSASFPLDFSMTARGAALIYGSAGVPLAMVADITGVRTTSGTVISTNHLTVSVTGFGGPPAGTGRIRIDFGMGATASSRGLVYTTMARTQIVTATTDRTTTGTVHAGGTMVSVTGHEERV